MRSRALLFIVDTGLVSSDKKKSSLRIRNGKKIISTVNVRTDCLQFYLCDHRTCSSFPRH